VDSGELKISEWKKEELEDYRTRETKADSGELKISDWKREEGKDYRTRETIMDSGELKKSDKAADRQRLETYRSIIGLDVSAKGEKDAIKDLKLQLEKERKELEEEKKREMEKRKKYIEDRDFDEKQKVSLARDKLRMELEKEKERLEESKKKEEERRKELLRKRGLLKKEGLNCWEYMRCGQEKFCPACPNRGKKCAHVVGNIEGRTPRGPLALQKDCINCKFYNSVHYDAG